MLFTLISVKEASLRFNFSIQSSTSVLLGGSSGSNLWAVVLTIPRNFFLSSKQKRLIN